MKLTDIAPIELWEEMLASRMISKSLSSGGELAIYNYTAGAQYSNTWNEVTMSARGLVVEEDSCEIVGRPLRKFFSPAGQELPGGMVEVSEKLDGSLGVVFYHGGRWQIATRGSFISDQAKVGGRMLEKIASSIPGSGTLTWLVEIIYPENRIVVDYQGASGLFLVGAVQNATGKTLPLSYAQKLWPGKSAEVFSFKNAQEAISAPARKGQEGLVLHFLETDERMKVKYPEYVRVHKIVTEVSELRVWESLVAGDDIMKTLEGVPDESFEFIATTRDAILAKYAGLDAQVSKTYKELELLKEEGAERKEIAERCRSLDPLIRSCVFLALDGSEYGHLLWKKLRPSGGESQWKKPKREVSM